MYPTSLAQAQAIKTLLHLRSLRCSVLGLALVILDSVFDTSTPHLRNTSESNASASRVIDFEILRVGDIG